MQPITLYIFIHNDVPNSTINTLGRAYFKEFTDEITAITKRSFIFKDIRNVRGMTDFNYKSQNVDGVIKRWELAAIQYKNQQGLKWGKTERYILVTQAPLNETTLGVAYSGQPAVIACLKDYQVIAHEVGHSFNASHNDAALGYNPWGVVCETFMFPQASALRSNCYRFTPKNRENIIAFLSDAP